MSSGIAEASTSQGSGPYYVHKPWNQPCFFFKPHQLHLPRLEYEHHVVRVLITPRMSRTKMVTNFLLDISRQIV